MDQELDDYADGDAKHGPGSPLLTLAKVAAAVAGLFLALYLALVAIFYLALGVPQLKVG
jgi:hypothetical protein